MRWKIKEAYFWGTTINSEFSLILGPKHRGDVLILKVNNHQMKL